MRISSSLAQRDDITVPTPSIPYILYQRTHYLALPRHRFAFKVLHKLSGQRGLPVAVAVEAACRRRGIRRSFNADMWAEYDELRPWLPDHATAILDIGCGVGGIDVLLHRHYGCPSDLHFFLLDKTSVDAEVHYGFAERASFYNSLEVTRSVLESNAVRARNIHLQEVGPDHVIRVDRPLDLVVSLISWGFHYPVETYVDQVHRLLRPGGRVILDLRRADDGRAELLRRFRRVETVSETGKKLRVCAIR